MNIRIPPSINWLIKKYSHVSHELEKLEYQISELEDQRIKLAGEVEALRTVISLHEIPISADDIPKRRKNRKITQQKHGVITKLIYKCLSNDLGYKEYHSTDDVFLFIVNALNLTFETKVEKTEYRRAIRRRLKNLAWLGKILRKKSEKPNELGYWKLK